MPEKSAPSIDIFGLLLEKEEKGTKKKQREEMLATAGVKEYFPEGKIRIDKRTCWGLECKLCIKACPTNALYWKTGEVGIIDDLCVYCSACVLSCMVKDCIKIERKREDGKTERFSKMNDVVKTEDKINARKRFQRVSEIYPTAEVYCKKYNPRNE
jgi:Na+-translocating ferredoxin:NAD+ oxidoreductase RNF subunit RnfB